MILILIPRILFLFLLFDLNGSNIVTPYEQIHGFISDNILNGIIPNVSESWKTLKEILEQPGTQNNSDVEKQIFWGDILIKRLKTYHEEIREVDRVVKNNAPSVVLDPIVNITVMNDLRNLSNRIENIDETLNWLDYVKEGWIRISSMTMQIHSKYNWIFDHIFEEGMSDHTEYDFESILNDTRQIYYAWFHIRDRGVGDEQYCLDMSELSSKSKTVATGTEGVEKNLFHGLRTLLNLEGNPSNSNSSANASDPCPTNETISGKRGSIHKYVPVYVLLHLLNAEFKYYLIKNIANMYICAHSRKCDYEIQEESKTHLNLYYEFYFSGITEAFNENKEDDTSPSKIPKTSWRWRCDPPLITPTTPDSTPRRDHRENATYTRFYDFETTFIEDERNISLTQTCRDSCNMFDGSYSSIPCEQDNWNCLNQEKHFDCYERKKRGLLCPGKARVLCPDNGISCQTTTIKTAEVCKGHQEKRFIEWIDTDAMSIMGKKLQCKDNKTIKLSSEEIMERAALTKHEPQRCEICLCKCYEPLGNDTHRYISLNSEVADVENGYILVGAKFLKIRNVVYTVIAEAKLVNGHPDVASVRWKEPAKVDINNDTQRFRMWRGGKRVLLDDFVAPSGYVVTGLRFSRRLVRRVGDYKANSDLQTNVVYLIDASDSQTWQFGFNNSEMAFEVQLTPLNSEGMLNVNESKWVINPNNSDSRTEVKIEDPDEPVFSPEASLPKSSSNQFIEVQRSSLSKDAGQTPIPFFDAQELVEMDELGPVRGIGLFYKGRPGFGGFLAFRIISLHLSDIPPHSTYELWRVLKDGKRKSLNKTEEAPSNQV